MPSGSGRALEAAVLVGVAGVGHRDHQRADVRLVEQRLDLVEGHVVGVRALVVAPAHVQPHRGRVDAVERAVDGVDDQLDPRRGTRRAGGRRTACGARARGRARRSAAAGPRSTMARYSVRSAAATARTYSSMRRVVPVLHRRGDDARASTPS